MSISGVINSKSIYHIAILKEANAKSNLILWNVFYFSASSKPVSYFLFLLRTSEYYRNCKTGVLNNLIHKFVKYLKYRQSLKLGFSIPDNVFDLGLQLPHYGTIVVNANAKVGKNCRLHVCTNIGASGGGKDAPKIGDNVYIAPGVKIYGSVEIADNTSIAANAAVSSSFLIPGKLIGGVPARELKNYDN